MLMTAPAGNDLLFDEDLRSQGSSLQIRFGMPSVWWECKGGDGEMNPSERLSINWMRNRIAEALIELENSFEKYGL